MTVARPAQSGHSNFERKPMRTEQENLQAVGDYARYQMMKTKITGFMILVLVVFSYWFLSH
jgi:hypothetical protein